MYLHLQGLPRRDSKVYEMSAAPTGLYVARFPRVSLMSRLQVGPKYT